MNWTRFALTVLASGIVSSLTDWLFMGDLLYKKYNTHSEIWRHQGGVGEAQAIAWASPLPFLTCAVFTIVCGRLHLFSYGATLKLALAAWLIGPFPMIVTNALFLKLQPQIAASHSLGWLVKLIIAAVAVVWILR
jgi:hypothetical protein